MDWELTLKKKPPQVIAKEHSPLLDELDKKQRKALKKTLQSAEPTEYFGQDYAKLGELVDMLRDLDLIKSDDKLKKKMKTLSEKNVDIVASASKLRKDYETLYKQIRGLIYPKRKGGFKR